MDYQLKGLILNCILKSYIISPIESANMLKVTMRFYGGSKYKSPQQQEELQAQEGKVPGQVYDGSCSGASSLSRAWSIPSPASLGGPVLASIETTLIKQAKDVEDEMRGLQLW